MKHKLLILQICSIWLSCLAISEEVKLNITWSINEEDGAYVNNQTGIGFPKEISNFAQTRATPVKEDGTASFAYNSGSATVTIYLGHKYLIGILGEGGALEVKNGFLKSIAEVHGEYKILDEFSLDFTCGEKVWKGVGTTVLIEKFSELNVPVCSEVGVILVGDFLYSYRVSFLDTEGLDDFEELLIALNIEKGIEQVANAPSLELDVR